MDQGDLSTEEIEQMDQNRREVTRGFVLGLAASALTAYASADTPRRHPPSETVLADAIAGKAVPAMAAIVIRSFGADPEIVAGVRAIGREQRVAPGDRWHLGSNGKAMTGTLIARLVEANVLAWDLPLAQMLPDLASSMRPEYRSVTLPDLLSHRAGLPQNSSDTAFVSRFYGSDASPMAQRLEYIDVCLREAPVGAARAAPSYSNTGLMIASAAAERATGRAFEELITSLVFTPLGMTSVSFVQLGGPAEPSGHVDGRIADRPSDANPPMFAPAGAMRMTMQDWSRFCIDQMAGETGRGRLLKADTYRFLHTGQGDTPSALGWGAAPHPMNLAGPALAHSGSEGNWYALVCLFPKTGNGVLVAANAGESMGGDQAASLAMLSLARTVAEAASPAG